MRKFRQIMKTFIALVLFLTMILPSNSIQAKENTKASENVIHQNLFNKSDMDNWMKALTYDGSKLTNATNYANMFTTHKIAAHKGDTLTWGKFGKDQYVMEVYDENDKFIERVFSADIDVEEGTTTVTGVGNKQYTEAIASYTLEDTKSAYVRILGNISTMNTFMVFKNLPDGITNWPTAYVPYQQNVDEDNPLLQKSALFVGDSITNAVKDPAHPYYGWAGRIGTTNDMDWKNAGISSATISTALPSSYAENRVVTQLNKQKDKKFDYVILHGGMNDSIAERALGTMTDSYVLEDFDINTFSGAMEELLYTATKEYKDAHIGFIINYATPNSTWGGLSNDNGAYHRRTKELCDKWNIPYIDLFEGGVSENGVYRSYSTDILKMNTGENLYNSLSTEIHLGSKGYDVISPYIGDWMKTLKPYASADSKSSLDFISVDQRHVTMNQKIKSIPNTMEAWVKLDTSRNQRQVIFGNYKDAPYDSFSLEITANGELRYYESTHEAGVKNELDVRTPNSICTEKWTHLAVVRDSQNKRVRILVNGKTQVEKTFTKVPEKPLLEYTHFVGTDHRKKFFLDGEVNSIRLWEQPKTDSEIATSMNLAVTGTETGLNHAWNFDGGKLDPTAVVKDMVRSDAVDGTAVNFPQNTDDPYEKNGINFAKNDHKIAMNEVLNEAPLTFESWIKLPKSAASKRGGVIAGNYFRYYSDTIPLVNFEIYNNGAPRLFWRIDGKEYNYVANNVNLCTGLWTHVTVSYDPQTNMMKCFVNGEKVDEQAMSFTPKNIIQPLGVGLDGRPESSKMNFQGEIAELRVWSTPRTEDEVKNTFNEDLTGKENGLLGNWKLDQNADGIYQDLTDNDNDIQDTWFKGDHIAKAEDGYKSIAIIPDPQIMSINFPKKFKAMTQWMVDNQQTYGIELAIPLGDLVHENEKLKQWEVARESMQILDGKIPYILIPGNHDTVKNSRDTTNYNTYFPYDKYSQAQSFGGAYEVGKMDNTYSFFTINGVDFMTLALETSPGEKVIEWANKVVGDHPDKKVIIATHNYMYLDGNRTTKDTEDQGNYNDNSHSGEEIWNNLAKKHKNIMLVLSGHIGYPDIVMREDEGIHGNRVQQVLCDAQWMEGEYSGLGMVMMFSFKEGADDVQINWYSTDRQQFFRTRNQFTTSADLTSSLEDNKTILKSAMGKAETLMAHADFKKLAPAVQSLIRARYDEAKVVYDDKSASSEQCFGAWKNLADALHYADFKADKAMLKTLIEECGTIDLTKYEEGVKEFETALSNAQNVYADANALQIRIDNAYNTLLIAKDALRKKPVIGIDKNTLAHMIEIAESIDQSNYKKDVYLEAFISALAEAKTIMNDKDASQAAVNASTEALAGAYESIRLLPDESMLKQLEDFLSIANGVSRSSYAPASLAIIDQAMTEAKAMLENQDFTKAEFTTFQSKMAKTLHIIKNEKITTVSEDAAKSTKDSAIKPATGDFTRTIALLSIVTLSGCALILIGKKRMSHKRSKG